MNEEQFYSLRCFSPYQGTVQVVQIPGFRAISDDGFTWRVQALQQRSRMSSYGIWRADGSSSLKESDGTRPIIQKLRNLPPLPFASLDKLELWLLDAENRRPFAIIDSAPGGSAPSRTERPVWRATLHGDPGFVSPNLAGAADGLNPIATQISHAVVVSRWVQKLAGSRPRAQWFLRDAAGGGVGQGGNDIGDDDAGRKLTRTDFPELLVREDLGSELERALVRDYHDWHAPNLLTHDNLTSATRDRLERAACRQPEKLYRVRSLLPDVVNSDLLKVAMVEAVIRRAADA
jgi:hypothetical protein